MFHWVAVIVGIILLILSLVYAFIVICSLIENTGYTVLSIIIGICHAVSPVLFVHFGYQCLLRRLFLCGIVLEPYRAGRSSGNVEDRASDSRADGSFSHIYLWISTINGIREDFRH